MDRERGGRHGDRGVRAEGVDAASPARRAADGDALEAFVGRVGLGLEGEGARAAGLVRRDGDREVRHGFVVRARGGLVGGFAHRDRHRRRRAARHVDGCGHRDRLAALAFADGRGTGGQSDGVGVVVAQRHRGSRHRRVRARTGHADGLAALDLGVLFWRQREGARSTGGVGRNGDREVRNRGVVRAAGGRAATAHRHFHLACRGNRRGGGGRHRHRGGGRPFAHARGVCREGDRRVAVVVGQCHLGSRHGRVGAGALHVYGLVALHRRVLGRGQGEGARAALRIGGDGDFEIRHRRVVRSGGGRAAVPHLDPHRACRGNRLLRRRRHRDRRRGCALRHARRARRKRDGMLVVVGQRKERTGHLVASAAAAGHRDKLVALHRSVLLRRQLERGFGRRLAFRDGDRAHVRGGVVRGLGRAVATCANGQRHRRFGLHGGRRGGPYGHRGQPRALGYLDERRHGGERDRWQFVVGQRQDGVRYRRSLAARAGHADGLVAFEGAVVSRRQGERSGAARGVGGDGDREVGNSRVVRTRGRRAAVPHRHRHRARRGEGVRRGGRHRHRGGACPLADGRRTCREGHRRVRVGQRQCRRVHVGGRARAGYADGLVALAGTVLGRRQGEGIGGARLVGGNGDVEVGHRRVVRAGGRRARVPHRHRQRARRRHRPRRRGRHRHLRGRVALAHARRVYRERDGLGVGQRNRRSFARIKIKMGTAPVDVDRLVALEQRVLGRRQGEGPRGARSFVGNRDREVRHRRVVRSRGRAAAADRHRHVHVSVNRRVDVRRDRHRRGAVVLAHARHICRQSNRRVPFEDLYPVAAYLVAGREAVDREVLVVVAMEVPYPRYAEAL